MNLCEAFRALNALNEDTFSVDADGINKLSAFEQSDDLTDEISIIDPEVETEEELSDSYVGKVILDCCVCHSKLYKSKDEVTLDDEGLLANVGEECPYCYTPDGFKVIGEVVRFEGSDANTDDGSEEVEEGLLTGDINVDFNSKDAAVSVMGGNSSTVKESLKHGATKDKADMKPTPIRPSAALDWDEEIKFVSDNNDGDLEEGIFDFGHRKRKKEVERRNAEMKARLDQKYAKKAEDERAKWEQEQREKDARSRDTQRRLDAYDAVKRNSSSGRTSTSNTGHRGINYSGGDYYSESLNEASAVATRPSIASVLSKNMDSLYSYDNAGELRNAIMDIVNNSEVDPKEIAKLQRALFSKKSVSALLSTIGTYMTGERVVDTTGRNAEMNNSVNESVNNITIETDEDTVGVALDGNGGVNVTAEPTASADPAGDGETIIPVSDETMNEIEGNDTTTEEPTEGDEMDVNIDEFDEDSFDELGESYFKRIYENVNGYKTTSIKESNNQLIVEGTLKFNSGNLKKTSFVFEALDIDKNGRARFVGDNKQITEGKKAFTLVGKVSGNKFITESMNYNYRDKGTNGKTTRVYGNARVSKRG